MTSPESSLRRRGRGSISDHSHDFGHSRSASDGFGSFVEASAFPTAFDPGLSDPLETGASSSASTSSQPPPATGKPAPIVTNQAKVGSSTDDDWQEADLVSSFSPIDSHHTPKPPMPPQTPKRKSIGKRGVSSEWSDWDSFLASHTLPTNSREGDAGKQRIDNPADEAFFDAFETATKLNRPPSPPIIDLRNVERKLESKSQQSRHASRSANPQEDDFFSRFERAPEQALGRASPLVLEPEQLESMRDARTSPMHTTHINQKDSNSYFAQVQSQPRPIEKHVKPASTSSTASKPSHSTDPTVSISPASPSSWTGSLRKTWSTLRSLPNEIVSHLPSASDFIVPPEEGEEQVESEASNPGGGLFLATEQRRPSNGSARSKSPDARPHGSIAHASDYSQSTPFGASSSFSSSGFSAGAASSSSASHAPLRARDLFTNTGPLQGSSSTLSSMGTLRRGPLHSATAPISGAPGFDTTSSRKWNTGHWTLDERTEKERRTIPVTLSDRREETDHVIEDWHASRLQAVLPPRLQLGKRWKLLYSLDQHGISLQTLYHRVASGLDPTLVRKVSDNIVGVASAEGWLRGASKETQEAMGTRSSNGNGDGKVHVGGGISSISDAGLILAVKDEEDNVFGAFVNEKFRPQQHYYGSGECFLWKTSRVETSTSSLHAPLSSSTSSGTEGDEKEISVYKWTGKNDYMVLSESTFLSVGGGNGKFGLWIDGALEKGVSDTCPAFDNDILCDPGIKNQEPRQGQGQAQRDARGEKRFTCYGLEVWAVGID